MKNKNNNKRKKYQKPALKTIKIEDMNIKAMTMPQGQICMITSGAECHA